MKKKIAILGSTGSIGTQALSVIRQHPDLFEASVLTAGRNADLLISQAREFLPDSVVIADESKYRQVSDALADLPVKVYAGEPAIAEIVESQEVNMVLTAMVALQASAQRSAPSKPEKPSPWPTKKPSSWLEPTSRASPSKNAPPSSPSIANTQPSSSVSSAKTSRKWKNSS